jgi:hypothetical protein
VTDQMMSGGGEAAFVRPYRVASGAALGAASGAAFHMAPGLAIQDRVRPASRLSSESTRPHLLRRLDLDADFLNHELGQSMTKASELGRNAPSPGIGLAWPTSSSHATWMVDLTFRSTLASVLLATGLQRPTGWRDRTIRLRCTFGSDETQQPNRLSCTINQDHHEQPS